MIIEYQVSNVRKWTAHQIFSTAEDMNAISDTVRLNFSDFLTTVPEISRQKANRSIEK
jgi:hypothetical protein